MTSAQLIARLMKAAEHGEFINRNIPAASVRLYLRPESVAIAVRKQGSSFTRERFVSYTEIDLAAVNPLLEAMNSTLAEVIA